VSEVGAATKRFVAMKGAESDPANWNSSARLEGYFSPGQNQLAEDNLLSTIAAGCLLRFFPSFPPWRRITTVMTLLLNRFRNDRPSLNKICRSKMGSKGRVNAQHQCHWAEFGWVGDRLSKLSGHELDRQYMRKMIEVHKEDLKAFQREADEGRDPDVKQFANNYAPVIKKHLEMAETTGQQLKATF
jgi:hypothetical protein